MTYYVAYIPTCKHVNIVESTSKQALETMLEDATELDCMEYPCDYMGFEECSIITRSTRVIKDWVFENIERAIQRE